MTDLDLVVSKVKTELEDFSKIISKELSVLIPINTPLSEAMRYSALNIGKSIRPYLLYQVANLFNIQNNKTIIRAAAIIEIIHCYSLIHDDLPSMDNDDLRRGQLSCHKKFNEATAILAGDSLLTLAFEILSSDLIECNKSTKCDLINSLAKAIGCNGMAGGQMLDLDFENKTISSQDIVTMLNMKTSYLFAYAAQMGAILANANLTEISIIKNYALKLGLSFQLMDDILDYSDKETQLGKTPNKDKTAGKATLVNLFGKIECQEYAKNIAKEAIAQIKKIPNKNIIKLINLVYFNLYRSY